MLHFIIKFLVIVVFCIVRNNVSLGINSRKKILDGSKAIFTKECWKITRGIILMSNAIFHSDFFSEISLLLQNFHSLQVSISQEQAKKHQKAIWEKSFPIAEEGNNVLTYSPKKCLHMKYFCFQKKMISIFKCIHLYQRQLLTVKLRNPYLQAIISQTT